MGSIENLHGRYKTSWVNACEWAADRVPGTAFRAPKKISDALKAMAELKNGRWVETVYNREQAIEGELAEAIYAMVGALVRDEIDIRCLLYTSPSPRD